MGSPYQKLSIHFVLKAEELPKRERMKFSICAMDQLRRYIDSEDVHTKDDKRTKRLGELTSCVRPTHLCSGAGLSPHLFEVTQRRTHRM